MKQYEGKPVSFTLTGAGVSLANLLCIPGSSKMVYEMIIPYDPKASMHFTELPDNNINPCVSAAVAEGFFQNAYKRNGDNCTYVAVTGALTTNRYRRGEDHAFIYIGSDIYHFQYNKLTQEQWVELNEQGLILEYRLMQDYALSEWIIKMLVYGEDKKDIGSVAEGIKYTVVKENS